MSWWSALWLVLGAGIGVLVATLFTFAIFDAAPGESAWQSRAPHALRLGPRGRALARAQGGDAQPSAVQRGTFQQVCSIARVRRA